jgi:hypothetical protein
MAQTSFSNALTAGRAGLLVDSFPSRVVSKIAEDAVRNGLLCQFGTSMASGVSPGECKLVAELTADVNDLLAATATAATALSITSASTPALSTSLMSPARRVTATLNSHADWNATSMRVYGEDAYGNAIRDEIAIPDAGNATVTSHMYFRRVTKVELDAQGGTNGSFTMGWSADDALFTRRESGVVVYNPAHGPYTSDDGYTALDSVGVMIQGRIWVPVEGAVSDGAPAYVRTATATTNIRGQWAGAPAANFAAYPNAFFRSATSGAGLAILELL